ncbi:MAG: flagellar basal body P-ring formation chaperone FlgA [Nitrospiraceae bacterium]
MASTNGRFTTWALVAVVAALVGVLGATGFDGAPMASAHTPKVTHARDQVKAVEPVRTARRGVQRVTTDHLRRAINVYLQGRLDGRISEIDVEILEPTEPLTVSSGRLQFTVASGTGLDQSGRRRFEVVPTVDGHAADPIDVIADVSLYADVVVPARVLKPEDVIDVEDLSTARVKIPSLPHQLITQVSDAVGKSPGRMLPSQQPIRLASLVKPLTVHKGDRVTIEARRGNLAIQAVGTTKTSGQLGSFVTVTNSDSGKDIRAKVVGPGTVRVDF